MPHALIIRAFRKTFKNVRTVSLLAGGLPLQTGECQLLRKLPWSKKLMSIIKLITQITRAFIVIKLSPGLVTVIIKPLSLAFIGPHHIYDSVGDYGRTCAMPLFALHRELSRRTRTQGRPAKKRN